MCLIIFLYLSSGEKRLAAVILVKLRTLFRSPSLKAPDSGSILYGLHTHSATVSSIVIAKLSASALSVAVEHTILDELLLAGVPSTVLPLMTLGLRMPLEWCWPLTSPRLITMPANEANLFVSFSTSNCAASTSFSIFFGSAGLNHLMRGVAKWHVFFLNEAFLVGKIALGPHGANPPHIYMT